MNHLQWGFQDFNSFLNYNQHKYEIDAIITYRVFVQLFKMVNLLVKYIIRKDLPINQQSCILLSKNYAQVEQDNARF